MEKTYKEKEFVIETDKPSEIVLAGFEKLNLPENFKVLDLGCGNGRNSIYAATLGGLVESVDLVDLELKQNIPGEIRDRISFHEMSVMDFDIKQDVYTAIIASRLIQYLTKYKHTIDEIRQTLQKNSLEIFSLEGKSGFATHVPYRNPNETYDILIKSKIGT